MSGHPPLSVLHPGQCQGVWGGALGQRLCFQPAQQLQYPQLWFFQGGSWPSLSEGL